MVNYCENNPVLPSYSKAKPIRNPNCVGGENDIIATQSASGKPIELIAGFEIAITDQSDDNTNRFLIAWNPALALEVALSLAAYNDTDDLLTMPVLWGTNVKKIHLQWTYNKQIVSQTLLNTGGLTPPTLDPLTAEYIYDNLTFKDIQTVFTIHGDDGLGLSGSIAEDTANLTFGNYRGWGIGARMDLGGTSNTAMITFLQGLLTGGGSKELTTTRVKNPLTCAGGNLDYFYYFYPKRFGLATFYQNGIPGGFKRLKKVGGFMQEASMDQVDMDESDLLVSNGVETEAFFVYQTATDDNNGAIIDVR